MQKPGLAPSVYRFVGHPEAVGGFQGRQQPAFVQPLMAGLESVVVPDHLYQHRIEGVAVSASVPALVENRCDLAIGVVVQQPVDLGNDLVTGLMDLTREWTRFPGELSGRAAAQPHPEELPLDASKGCS